MSQTEDSTLHFDQEDDEFAAVEMPIDGTLDLHTFSPKDTKTLIPDYLDECRQRGIFNVRIVHGKGKGVLRRSVQATLDRLDTVESCTPAGEGGGGWGATLVVLKRP